MRLIFPLLMFIVSCGTLPPHIDLSPLVGGQSPNKVDFSTDLLPYLDDFMDDARFYEVNPPVNRLLAMRYVKDDEFTGNVVARCSRMSFVGITSSIIRIRESEKDSYRIKTIVYHELGHCLLDLPHTEGREDIMSVYIPKKEIIETYWELMVADLFNSFKEGANDGW